MWGQGEVGEGRGKGMKESLYLLLFLFLGGGRGKGFFLSYSLLFFLWWMEICAHAVDTEVVIVGEYEMEDIISSVFPLTVVIPAFFYLFSFFPLAIARSFPPSKHYWHF